MMRKLTLLTAGAIVAAGFVSIGPANAADSDVCAAMTTSIYQQNDPTKHRSLLTRWKRMLSPAPLLAAMWERIMTTFQGESLEVLAPPQWRNLPTAPPLGRAALATVAEAIYLRT